MSKLSHDLLLIYFTTVLAVAAATATAATNPSAVNFIKDSCGATTFPDVCVRSLSVYADIVNLNPRRLAEAALNVSINRAQTTEQFMSRVSRFEGLKERERQAVKDCVECIGLAVGHLTDSVPELRLCGEARDEQFRVHMGNIRAWIDAAEAQEGMCSDGFVFMNGRLKSLIQSQIGNLDPEISNARDLISAFASKK